jgi:hypothetical protein
VIGSERINHYGAELPGLIKPTWFFAAMTLLDHLRDCPGPGGKKDYSEELKGQYGEDFLKHAQIWVWYNEHALVERHYLAEEEVE